MRVFKIRPLHWTNMIDTEIKQILKGLNLKYFLNYESKVQKKFYFDNTKKFAFEIRIRRYFLKKNLYYYMYITAKGRCPVLLEHFLH